ncbi:acyl CoA:acetate/3-ketoacid CoA transferase [bacterium]|nr:MAG: acyl CoA:acetate/3-ketoacid CoA transferase [bacterium]
MAEVCTAKQAILKIKDDSVLVSTGFRWASSPELLLSELRKRFDETGSPKGLTLVFSSAQGDSSKPNGLEHLSVPGLLKRVIGGFWGTIPQLMRLALENKIEAYNFPQGQISALYRAIASGSPGVLTKVGIETYMDPREEGGRLNSITPDRYLQIVKIRDEEWMLYESFPVDVVFIRGSTADEEGNVSFEEEAASVEGLSSSIAARNSGGTVIVQVKRIVPRGSIPAQRVVIPAHLVDYVVICTDVETQHRQSVSKVYDPIDCGEPIGKSAADQLESPFIDQMPLTRSLIAHRASLELEDNQVVNLGQGIPTDIVAILKKRGDKKRLFFTLESGVNGGIPYPVPDFGISAYPTSILRQEDQFLFYDGGGLDIAFLGFAEVDQHGNVNVSKFSGKYLGSGGFMDIVQATNTLVFCGSFTAHGLTLGESKDGSIQIIAEGKVSKFVKKVSHVTFSGRRATLQRKRVLYITERCVFELTREGLLLSEVAPGVDPSRDILAHMEFLPIISSTLMEMPIQ